MFKLMSGDVQHVDAPLACCHLVQFGGQDQTRQRKRPGQPWEDAPRVSTLVFIGRDLPREIIVTGLQQCLK